MKVIDKRKNSAFNNLRAGKIVAEGTAEEIKHSTEPYVHQFVWGEPDGPVNFHYPATRPYGEEMLSGPGKKQVWW